MDAAAQVKNAAAQTRQKYRDLGGLERTIAFGGPFMTPFGLREWLEILADRVFGLCVCSDDAFLKTNVKGVLEEDYIKLRPDLSMEEGNFVIAHELGHKVLGHPMRLYDTSRHLNPDIAPDDLSDARMQSVTGLDLPAGGALTLCGYNERDGYELQANAFASELLASGELIGQALALNPGLRSAEIADALGISANLARVGMKQALAVPPSPLESKPATRYALDAQQQKAVDCPTPALIVAGPGAGKTAVLTHRFARRVADGVEPRQILCLTFSNKAAAEMRERIAKECGADVAAQMEVYTFHAFGLHLLQQYGSHIGLPAPLRLLTPIDAFLMFRRKAMQMNLAAFGDVHKSFEVLKNMLDNISRSKDENADPERWQQLADEWAIGHPGEKLPVWTTDNLAFFREYQKTLRHYGLLDYGDLQTEALRLFGIPAVAEEIRARYIEILVDEIQDINYVSGLLVRGLDGPPDAGRGIVWAVGDPRQSIYGFRGASPVNLSRFRSAEYYPTASVIALTNNYRSYPDIVAAGAAVLMPDFEDRDILPPGLTAMQQPPKGNDAAPYVVSHTLPHGSDEIAWVAQEIHALCQQGRSLKDIAILVKKNDQATEIASALLAAGITHNWGGPIENRGVFKVLMSVLYLAIDDPKGIVGLTTVSPGWTLTPEEPMSETDRRALFAPREKRLRARKLLDEAVKGQIPGLSDEGIDACRHLQAIALALPPSYRPHENLIVYLFEYARWLRPLWSASAKAQPEVRALLQTIHQILDLTANFASQREALSRCAPIEKTESPNTTLEEDILETAVSTGSFLDYVSAVVRGNGFGASKELDMGDAVTVMTTHKSKGLEWPVVFVPYCADLRSNDREAGIPLPPGLINTDGDSEATMESRDKACAFYVSLTRAREKLYLTSAEKYKKQSKGGISLLRQNVEEPLSASGRLLTPEPAAQTIAPNNATEAQEAVWLPYALPDEIHQRDIMAYKKCPKRFQFVKIYGLFDSDITYLQFHRVVYEILNRCASDPTLDPHAELEKEWQENGPPNAHWQAPLLRRTAGVVIDRCVNQKSDSSLSRSFREQKTITLTDDNGNSCTIQFTPDELITLENNMVRYSRHKNNAKTPKDNKPDDEDPLPLLCALHAEQEGKDAEIGFYYPLLNATIAANVSDRRKKGFVEKWQGHIADIRAGKMPPNPSSHDCKQCAFVLICSSAE